MQLRKGKKKGSNFKTRPDPPSARLKVWNLFSALRCRYPLHHACVREHAQRAHGSEVQTWSQPPVRSLICTADQFLETISRRASQYEQPTN